MKPELVACVVKQELLISMGRYLKNSQIFSMLHWVVVFFNAQLINVTHLSTKKLFETFYLNLHFEWIQTNLEFHLLLYFVQPKKNSLMKTVLNVVYAYHSLWTSGYLLCYMDDNVRIGQPLGKNTTLGMDLRSPPVGEANRVHRSSLGPRAMELGGPRVHGLLQSTGQKAVPDRRKLQRSSAVRWPHPPYSSVSD